METHSNASGQIQQRQHADKATTGVCRSIRIIIREIRTGEFPLCAALYERAWNGAMPHSVRVISVADFEHEIQGELTFVAILHEALCGYISVWEPDWFIHHLYIEPSLQGAGAGKALLQHVSHLAAENSLSLKCQIANTQALQFYGAAGFVQSGERGSDEYGDWVLLTRQPE